MTTAKKTTAAKATVKKAAAKETTAKKTTTKKTTAKKTTKKSVVVTPELIQVEAYLLAEKDQFNGNPVGYWLQAEANLKAA